MGKGKWKVFKTEDDDKNPDQWFVTYRVTYPNGDMMYNKYRFPKGKKFISNYYRYKVDSWKGNRYGERIRDWVDNQENQPKKKPNCWELLKAKGEY